MVLKALVAHSDVLSLAPWDVVADEVQRGELGVLSLGNLLQQSAYGLVSRAGHSLSPAAEEWQRLLLEQDRALPAVADQ